MISNLDPSSQQFLNGLDRIEDRMGRAQRRITTGVRISQVSDDPDHIAALLRARAELEAAKQIKLNMGRIKAEVNTAEQTLRHAIDLFERARTLGAQGATATQTAATREAIAQEITSVLEQIVGVTSTAVEGRFVFSGDADQVAPYTIDVTQADPVSAYQGAAATRQVQHPNGSTFRVSWTAQEIFDSTDPATSVFDTVNAVRNALLANDEAAIIAATESLAAAGAYLNSRLAFYGTAQNKVAEAEQFGESLQLDLQTQISSFEDADLTEAILELQQGETQQQAALTSWSRLPRTTLFDYIG